MVQRPELHIGPFVVGHKLIYIGREAAIVTVILHDIRQIASPPPTSIPHVPNIQALRIRSADDDYPSCLIRQDGLCSVTRRQDFWGPSMLLALLPDRSRYKSDVDTRGCSLTCSSLSQCSSLLLSLLLLPSFPRYLLTDMFLS